MRIVVMVLSLFMLGACQNPDGEPVTTKLPSAQYNYTEQSFDSLQRKATTYVPVYSDIYHMDGTRRFLLTATVSVRNANLRDTIFVNQVNYFDSQGQPQRHISSKQSCCCPSNPSNLSSNTKRIKAVRGQVF